MGDKNSGWRLDIPSDPNKLASYSSSYVKDDSSSENLSKEVLNEPYKKAVRKEQASQPSTSKK